MRLFIGIPSGGNPAQPFLRSLAELAIPEIFTAVEHATVTGNFVPGQRELLVRKAIASRADFVLMCDDDIIVPPDAIAKLYDLLAGSDDCALAGALYYARDGMRPMVAANWNSSNTTSAYVPAFDEVTPIFVDAVGFGTMLLRVRALDALRPPFFNTQVFMQTSASHVRVCNEDYLLCERLRRAKYRIALHPGVRCGHYDRVSGITFPQRWESPASTNADRMMVSVDGTIMLQPYDKLMKSSPEQHETGSLDYLIVD